MCDGKAITVRSEIPGVQSFIRDVCLLQHQLTAVSMMLPVGLHEFLERKVQYISFVRHPIKRCLSALNFVYAKRDTHPFAPKYQQCKYSISKLIDSDEILFSNDQVRFLSGSNRVQVGMNELEDAKKNALERFVFIGVTEHFGSCWKRIETLLGWRSDSGRTLNQGVYDATLQINSHDMDCLLKSNQFDFLLYNWLVNEYLPKMHGMKLPSIVPLGEN